MKKPTLKQLKKVICSNCKTYCSYYKDEKCIMIEEIEKLFGVKLK